MNGRARLLLLFPLAVTLACQSPARTPAPEPAPVAAAGERPQQPPRAPIGTLRVTASKLNVRSEPSADAAVIGSVKKGDRLGLVDRGTKGWFRVVLASGETGWIAAQYAREVKTCPPDREFRIVQPPPLAFDENGAHGVVVVEATVGADGNVVATKVVRNETADPERAAAAEREIRLARFEAPVRNCTAKRFIYTYRRTF
ncbi:MAG TPA: SH3 domain-containing protein [Thermoanaerobaculia bacterium]